MAKKARRVRGEAAGLVKGITRRWERGTRRALTPEVRAHLRAAGREGLLAIASLCEEILRGVEERTRRARRRVERIPVTGRAPSWPRTPTRRKRSTGRRQ